MSMGFEKAKQNWLKRVKRRSLYKKSKQINQINQWWNVMQLIKRTKEEERERVAKLLDDRIPHDKLECGNVCDLHRQIKFIRNIKE